MERIKIISVPPGEVPYRIREQWVGVEVLCFEAGARATVSVFGGLPNPRNCIGYAVLTTEVISALKKRNATEAAEWWERWAKSSLADGCVGLVFPENVCQVIR